MNKNTLQVYTLQVYHYLFGPNVSLKQNLADTIRCKIRRINDGNGDGFSCVFVSEAVASRPYAGSFERSAFV